MGIPAHTAILNRAAKEHLKPMGVIQKGRSRFWYSDEGWCTITAEFQPFSGRTGSALNVGVHWLWYPNDCWSYDLGGRASDFFLYENETQFEAVAKKLAYLAGQNFMDCRNNLSTLDQAYEFAAGQEAKDWSHLHLAMLAALRDKLKIAEEHLNQVYDNDPKYEWIFKRNDFIDEMRSRICDTNSFQGWVIQNIDKSRELLRLDSEWNKLLPPIANEGG